MRNWLEKLQRVCFNWALQVPVNSKQTLSNRLVRSEGAQDD